MAAKNKDEIDLIKSIGCKGCIFGVPEGFFTERIICKRFPPIFSGSGGFQRNPEMALTDWCGELIPKE